MTNKSKTAQTNQFNSHKNKFGELVRMDDSLQLSKTLNKNK